LTEEGTRQLEVSTCGNYSQEPYQHAYGYYSERVATHTELPENQYLWDVLGYPSVGHIFLNWNIFITLSLGYLMPGREYLFSLSI